MRKGEPDVVVSTHAERVLGKDVRCAMSLVTGSLPVWLPGFSGPCRGEQPGHRAYLHINLGRGTHCAVQHGNVLRSIAEEGA